MTGYPVSPIDGGRIFRSRDSCRDRIRGASVSRQDDRTRGSHEDELRPVTCHFVKEQLPSISTVIVTSENADGDIVQ